MVGGGLTPEQSTGMTTSGRRPAHSGAPVPVVVAYLPWIFRVRDRDGDSPWLRELSRLAQEFEDWSRGTGVAHLDLRDHQAWYAEVCEAWLARRIRVERTTRG